MKIIVCGYMVRHPVIGNVLAFLHYVMGFSRLGHEVVYVEESGWPDSCYHPSTGMFSGDPAEGLQVLYSLMRRFGLDTPVCYVDRESGEAQGCSRQQLKRHLASADLLVNVGGTCSLAEFEQCPRRIFIDMDPLFTQLGRFGAGDLDTYDLHFSYGANIGTPGCTIRDARRRWLPTQPPVVPEIWSTSLAESRDGPATRPMTTIGNWNAYGAIEHEGIRYGQKGEEFLKLIGLPRRTSEKLELALSGAGDDVIARLTANGWAIRSADEVTLHWDSYASYIRASKGEFSVAKHAYVTTASGWFSDRSVCYLASGRPVVLQDTGIGRWLPRSPAVLTFSTLDEAAACLDQLNADYPMRCREAREVAERCFSHRVVLPRLLDRAFSSTPTSVTDRGCRVEQ